MKRVAGKVKRQVWRKDKFICQLKIAEDCIKKLDINNATIDHKIAVCNKGKNDIDNLQTACRPCNEKKALQDRREKEERRAREVNLKVLLKESEVCPANMPL